MPSFGIFGSKKKSKSTLTLAGNFITWPFYLLIFSFGPGDKWRGEGERSSYSLETEGHNRKMISKVQCDEINNWIMLACFSSWAESTTIWRREMLVLRKKIIF